jgi:hypothetical protein
MLAVNRPENFCNLIEVYQIVPIPNFYMWGEGLSRASAAKCRGGGSDLVLPIQQNQFDR